MGTKKRNSSKEDFFLPNFCSVRSAFILAIAAPLISILLILATGDVLSESWDELGLLSLFVLWIMFISAAELCLARKWLAKLSTLLSALTAYFIIVATTGIIAAIAQYLLLKINYQWGNAPETIGDFVIRCISISAIVTLISLRYFYVQQQWKERIELESEARVEALQARIRPHFLFNSMNIIASLIQTQPKLAEQAVEDLSEIFRATLRDRGSMVPLTEEWILCRNYLRIEGLRLGERLTLNADLSKVPEDAAIPMLTLQPLMENAIYHGIAPLEKGGIIQVEGKMEDNIITILISNPIPHGEYTRAHKGNKIAMANIRHRLNLLFGSHAKLKADISQDQYKVILTFPYLKSGM